MSDKSLDSAAVRAWAETVGIDPLDASSTGIAHLDNCIERSRVVVLGEPNHFIHEKVEFRLWWLERLARRYPLVLAEELGWADGRRIARYLNHGDERDIAGAATFGYLGWRRSDRDDAPTGVFAPAKSAYPTDAMRWEHTRLYRAVRALGVRDFYGFDIDLAGGVAYEILHDAEAPDLARRPGESLPQELERLTKSLSEPGQSTRSGAIEQDLLALRESLAYTALVKDAADYNATRPAMAAREEAMKRRVTHIISAAPSDAKVALMAHAFHLAKDDAKIDSAGGVGPGGDRVSSLGHYLNNELRVPMTAAWMLYSEGRDCQPLNDLPRKAAYPATTFNRQVASPSRRILPLQNAPFAEVTVGHMYNATSSVHLAEQADAVDVFSSVSPLRTSTATV